jgi:hypothetical protein
MATLLAEYGQAGVFLVPEPQYAVVCGDCGYAVWWPSEKIAVRDAEEHAKDCPRRLTGHGPEPSGPATEH